jgi:hypothetical protein
MELRNGLYQIFPAMQNQSVLAKLTNKINKNMSYKLVTYEYNE